MLEFPEGRILRPLLGTTRAEVEAYLRELGQDWREDTSNRHLTFTRNRIRHELLPLLEGWNPRLRQHLAQMAVLAREEETWWQAELARQAPQMLLPGRAVRGGGRAAGEGLGAGLAIEVNRLAALAPALQRRVVRYAAEQFGASLDFDATEAVRSLALGGRAGQKLMLPQGLRAERTARELRLTPGRAVGRKHAEGAPGAIPEYSVAIPGEIDAPAFGLRVRIEVSSRGEVEGNADGFGCHWGKTATLRNWRPGDRVRLRYTAGPRKVKEVLDRMKVTGTERAIWPVLEIGRRIVWMRGVELEKEPSLVISAAFAGESGVDSPSQARAKYR